jgi:hypothetical protein
LQWKMLVHVFYGHLVYFVAISYILWIFGIFFPVLVCCAVKNLAAPLQSRESEKLPRNRFQAGKNPRQCYKCHEAGSGSHDVIP